GRGRQPARPAAAVPRAQASRRDAVRGPGRGGVRALPYRAARLPDPDAADDGEPPQPDRVAVAARPVVGGGGGGGGRDGAAGDRGGVAARRRGPRGGRPDRRPRPW